MITKTNINDNLEEIYQGNIEAGWYTDINTGERLTRNIPEMLMLMVSEIAEAMEAYRKNLKDDKLPEYDGFLVELADNYIRMADTIKCYANQKGIEVDFDEIIYQKRLYNSKRLDHTMSHRRAGGKQF
jgi:hypothetical protein